MSQIELAGQGGPIPNIALPDPNIDPNMPVQILELKNGDVFHKEDWVTLGFTRFEVWCVGAAGGRGGSTGRLDHGEFHYYESMPPDIWEYYKEQKVLISEGGMQYQGYNGIWWYQNGPLIQLAGWASSDYWVHHADAIYPARNAERAINYKNFYIEEDSDQIPAPDYTIIRLRFGGGGGGGGTQLVSGLLDDLPDDCPVVVGQAGANGAIGQVRINGPWTPQKNLDFGYYLTEGPLFFTGYEGRLEQLTKWIAQWTYRFPSPMPSFYPPQPGGDGGASSFGGNVCQASGGKGGRPGLSWVGGVRTFDGAGGDGGVGGQLEAGGGAAGSNSNVPGADGTWISRIGKGGGGGRGGVDDYPIQDGTNGGRGTMSYADTSVYGEKDPVSYWVKTERTDVSYDVERPATENQVATTKKYIPGGGGGVRALGKFPYGSRATGYSPNGTVVLRLIKFE